MDRVRYWRVGTLNERRLNQPLRAMRDGRVWGWMYRRRLGFKVWQVQEGSF